MLQLHISQSYFTPITSNIEFICNYEKSDSIVTFDWFSIKIYFYPSKGKMTIKI